MASERSITTANPLVLLGQIGPMPSSARRTERLPISASWRKYTDAPRTRQVHGHAAACLRHPEHAQEGLAGEREPDADTAGVRSGHVTGRS